MGQALARPPLPPAGLGPRGRPRVAHLRPCGLVALIVLLAQAGQLRAGMATALAALAACLIAFILLCEHAAGAAVPLKKAEIITIKPKARTAISSHTMTRPKLQPAIVRCFGVSLPTICREVGGVGRGGVGRRVCVQLGRIYILSARETHVFYAEAHQIRRLSSWSECTSTIHPTTAPKYRALSGPTSREARRINET